MCLKSSCKMLIKSGCKLHTVLRVKWTKALFGPALPPTALASLRRMYPPEAQGHISGRAANAGVCSPLGGGTLLQGRRLLSPAPTFEPCMPARPLSEHYHWRHGMDNGRHCHLEKGSCSQCQVALAPTAQAWHLPRCDGMGTSRLEPSSHCLVVYKAFWAGKHLQTEL